MNLVPQFGFFELMLIGVIALVVVGPRDLPKLMRSAGKLAAKARKMAAEFTAAFDQMARETEMEELRREIETLKSENVFTKTRREIDESLRPVNKDIARTAGELRDAQSDGADAGAKPDEPVKS